MTRLHLCFASLAFAFAANSAAAETERFAQRPDAPAVALDRAAVRAKLAERREHTVKHFQSYRDAQVYPINRIGAGFRHVWIDGQGNLCAAATLISKDWGRDAAIRVGKGNNEIKLANVKSGPVLDWMLTSGLTRAELVAIQLPGGVFMGDDQRPLEVQRMYQIYVDVERQIRSLWNDNLDLATDALMKRPELAREVLAGRAASAGTFAKPPVG